MDTDLDLARMSTFKIYTGLLKASRGQDGKMRLHGTASSTVKDLHGDTMQPTAIDDMVAAANRNLTIFLNHSYNVPEDVGGSVERAKSYIRGVTESGDPNVDMDYDIVVNDANPRAVQTFEAIEKGTKLGLSIGAMIPQGGATKNKDGTYVINHVDLLETSIVGIPANPRSWVEYAVKSLRKADVPAGDADFVIDATPDPKTVEAEPKVTTSEPEAEKDLEADGVEKDLVEASVGETITLVADEPDVADSTTTVQVTVWTDDDSQSGSEKSGLQDETAEGDDQALGDDVTRAAPELHKTITETLSLLTESTRELVEARKRIVDLEAAKAAAERDRDDAVRQRDAVLAGTKDILDRVASSPLVRRTVAVDAQRDFNERFKGVYSDEFLAILKGTKHD